MRRITILLTHILFVQNNHVTLLMAFLATFSYLCITEIIHFVHSQIIMSRVFVTMMHLKLLMLRVFVTFLYTKLLVYHALVTLVHLKLPVFHALQCSCPSCAPELCPFALHRESVLGQS